jgi:membrane-associated phospholipid phosphatase
MKRVRKVRFSLFLLLIPSICFAQFQDTLKKHPPSNFDERLFFSINHWGEGALGLDGPAKFLSNTAFIPVIVAPLGMYTVGAINHDKDLAVAGFSTGAGLATSILLGEVILKNIVQRDRPWHVIEDTRLIDEGASGYSFPSGHTSSSFGLATGISLHYPKWYVIAPSYIYALAVTLSRPYLGAHYPTDLLGGAIIGVLCQVLYKELEKNYKDKWKIFPGNSASSSANFIRIGYDFPLR